METAPPRKNGWFAVVVVLTALWAFVGIATFVERWRHVDCGEVFEILPEPPRWQSWPREPGAVQGEGAAETLFGFRFEHHLPDGFKYGGYEDAKLTSARSCPGSSVELDSWLRTGETFWLRHPGELSRFRDPSSDLQVIAGQYGYDPSHGPSKPPRFVTAFRVKPQIRQGWEYFGNGVELLFVLLAGAGIWVIVLRARRSPRYGPAVVPIAVLSMLLLLAAIGAIANSAFDRMR